MKQYNKLRIEWDCRRGMLELDKMIMPFYKNVFDHLSDEQKDTFIELLTYTDPQLFRWLMNQEKAPTQPLQAMVDLIKQKLSSF
ncbi:succinate dehydrogenase assembly factor 2 [Gallibacterium melopsittaci]|uniref:FAD assembly factor SdhE n=1 Tax=Gallibacterium melopsittaci TaxID=516063 RepID=A0ABV6HYZ6_9PAST